MSVPSFYQWRKRLALEPGRKGMPLFVPVHVTQMPPQSRFTCPTERASACRRAMSNPCGSPLKRQARSASGAAEEVEAC